LINVSSVKGHKGWRNFREPRHGEVRRTGGEHGGLFARNLSGGKRHEEVRVLASESPQRLEELRESFLRALSELTSSGTSAGGKQAMVSEVAQQAGLDPEGDPQERALGERLAAELVEAGYASAEAGSSGFLVITPEGEQAVGGGAS
jgi:hypothetical protein